MSRVLLVDDERDLVWAMRQSLCDEGYEILMAYDGMEALAVARRNRPDLIILDIVMPRLDGLEVCHRLRRDPLLGSAPILFLTSRKAIEDRIAGLDAGGDDYLAKPFDLGELRARVRALLRRGSAATEGSRDAGERDFLLEKGPLILDRHTRQVHVGSAASQLTPAEFDILCHLMTHPREVFSSQQMLRQIWGYSPESADPSLVRWHIKNLRAKIEADPANPVYIRTVPHQGYILVC